MSRGRPPAPRLTASRDAPLGGQAVMEGVMMRGVGVWAVAVREPVGPGRPTGARGPVRVHSASLRTPSRPGARRIPVLRGVLALGESLGVGVRALAFSASAQLPPDEHGRPQEIPAGAWAGMAVVSLAVSVGLFFVVPVGATSLLRHQLGTAWLFWIVEGALRTGIFLAYLALLGRARDLRRVLEYHGAEHKVISCYEAGDPLTPERAALHSRLHPRCGTSFLLVVMILAIVVFAPIGLPAWWILVLTRILGVPVIAGLAFEVIRYAGRHRGRWWVRWLIAPGMRLQLLTTREPDLDQLGVALAALEAVLAVEAPGALDAEALLGLAVLA